MKKADRVSLIILPVLVLLAGLFALAGSVGEGTPLFGWLVGLAILVQWLAFIPAFLLQTEKFYDITGSITYIGVITLALVFGPGRDARAVLLWVLVTLWAVRLGSFLFGRIHKAGRDDRFDEIKPLFFRFLLTWTLQGLWVAFTVSAALAVMTGNTHKPLDAFALLGGLLWLAGFVFEVVADAQKSRFNANPANKGKFIQSGLWAHSRHPNYFGEIVLWLGIMLVAVPVLRGWQWVALISPLFVTLLLTRVSGIPLLEKKAEAKWGGQAEYEAYKQKTPVLIPRL